MAKNKNESTDETPTPAPPAPQSSGQKTVDEWANVKFPADKKGRRPMGFAHHAGAAALHGWAAHAHHENAPMELSEADYDKAVEAAKAPKPAGKPTKDNPLPREAYQPHRAALSKHHPAKKD